MTMVKLLWKSKHMIDFDKYFPKFCARNKNDLHSFQLKEDHMIFTKI